LLLLLCQHRVAIGKEKDLVAQATSSASVCTQATPQPGRLQGK
jgi:hypothetical protein